MPEGEIKVDDHKISPPRRADMKVKCILNWLLLQKNENMFYALFALIDTRNTNNHCNGSGQWRIQDFPEERVPQKWGRQPTILGNFSKNCMKIFKKLDPGSVPGAPLLDKPMGSWKFFAHQHSTIENVFILMSYSRRALTGPVLGPGENWPV